MSRANGYTSYRGSSRQARPSSADGSDHADKDSIEDRPDTAQLVDLHVYIVPPDIWREQFNNLLNQNVTETISAGIIRVHPEVKVYSLREEIDQQIGAELLPQDYVFLKSVGRSITRLKPKQEYQLKAKHFIPPQAYAPELFLLEVGPGDSRGSTGPHSPSIGQPYNSQSYHHPESEDGSQTGKNRHLRSTTSPYRYSPLPKIKQSRTSSKGESPRYDYGSHNGDTRGSREGLRGSQSRVSSRARSPPQTDRPQQANKHHHTDRPPHTDRPSYSDKPPSQPRSRPNSQPRDRPVSDNRSRQRSRERSRASSRHQSPARQGSPTTGHNSASPTPSSDRERDHDHHHRERDRRHQDRSPHKQEKYDGTYTNHTNEDSGINVITPEEHYEALDRRKPEEHRQTEVHARLQPTHDDDDDERQRRLQEEREREEWERRRREEEERRRKEEEEKRRREEEDQQREDDERRRREDEREQMTKDQKLTGSDEETNARSGQQTLRPPDVIMSSDRDTNKVQYVDNTHRNNVNHHNHVNGQNVGSENNGDVSEGRPENLVSHMSERDDVFVDSVTPERNRNGNGRPKDQYSEVRYPDNDSRSIHYEDDRLSNLSHPSRHSYVDGNMSDASNSSRVVVQINDEIMGKITPRVIVSINGNDYGKGEGGRTSYVKNRLKPYESGYLSGDNRYDSDHSVHSNVSRNSRYSNGRVSNRSRVTDRAKSSLRRPSIGQGGYQRDGNVSNGLGATHSDSNRSQNDMNTNDRRKDEGHSENHKDSIRMAENSTRTPNSVPGPELQETQKDQSTDKNSDVKRNVDSKADQEHNEHTNDKKGVVESNGGIEKNVKNEVKFQEQPKNLKQPTAISTSYESANAGIVSEPGQETIKEVPSGKTDDMVRNDTYVEENSGPNDGSGTYRKEEPEQDDENSLGRSRNGILQSRTDNVDEDGTRKKTKEVKWSDDVKPGSEDQNESPLDKSSNVSTFDQVNEKERDNETRNTADVPSDWSVDNNNDKSEAGKSQNDETERKQEPTNQSINDSLVINADEMKGTDSKEKSENNKDEEVKKNQIGLSKQTVENSHSFVKSDSDTVQSSHYHGDISDLGEGHPDASQRRKIVKKTRSDKDLNRFPSPPPMQVHDIHPERETESAKRRRKEEKERLLRELEAAREARRVVERQREELVKKAKAMQSKTQNRRNHADLEVSEDSENNADKKPNDDEARDVWKKRYFEEKKRTPPLEEQCNRLRHELDIIHRKLMNTLEGPSKDKSTRAGDMKPSQKNNYKIQATRLTHEIDDMRRRLENAKMKLTAEMKLRNQAETELRALRAELTQKKIHLTLTRNQQLAALTPGSSNQDLYMMPALTPKS